MKTGGSRRGQEPYLTRFPGRVQAGARENGHGIDTSPLCRRKAGLATKGTEGSKKTEEKYTRRLCLFLCLLCFLWQLFFVVWPASKSIPHADRRVGTYTNPPFGHRRSRWVGAYRPTLRTTDWSDVATAMASKSPSMAIPLLRVRLRVLRAFAVHPLRSPSSPRLVRNELEPHIAQRSRAAARRNMATDNTVEASTPRTRTSSQDAVSSLHPRLERPNGHAPTANCISLAFSTTLLARRTSKRTTPPS